VASEEIVVQTVLTRRSLRSVLPERLAGHRASEQRSHRLDLDSPGASSQATPAVDEFDRNVADSVGLRWDAHLIRLRRHPIPTLHRSPIRTCCMP